MHATQQNISFSNECEQLRKEKKEMADKIENLEETSKKKDPIDVELSIKLSSNKTQIADLTTQLSERDLKIDKISEELYESLKKYEKLEQQNQITNDEHNENANRSQGMIIRLRDELSSKEKRIGEAEKNINLLTSRNEKKSIEMSKLKRQSMLYQQTHSVNERTNRNPFNTPKLKSSNQKERSTIREQHLVEMLSSETLVPSASTSELLSITSVTNFHFFFRGDTISLCTSSLKT